VILAAVIVQARHASPRSLSHARAAPLLVRRPAAVSCFDLLSPCRLPSAGVWTPSDFRLVLVGGYIARDWNRLPALAAFLASWGPETGEESRGILLQPLAPFPYSPACRGARERQITGLDAWSVQIVAQRRHARFVSSIHSCSFIRNLYARAPDAHTRVTSCVHPSGECVLAPMMDMD